MKVSIDHITKINSTIYDRIPTDVKNCSKPHRRKLFNVPYTLEIDLNKIHLLYGDDFIWKLENIMNDIKNHLDDDNNDDDHIKDTTTMNDENKSPKRYKIQLDIYSLEKGEDSVDLYFDLSSEKFGSTFTLYLDSVEEKINKYFLTYFCE